MIYGLQILQGRGKNGWRREVKKQVLFLATGLLTGSIAIAATYYMPDDCANLHECFGVMQGGDTLIIRDGVYTGEENTIVNYQEPPRGSSSSYTKIVAEHKGKVVINGERMRETFHIEHSGITDAYWKISGIVFRNSSSQDIRIVRCSHIKFFWCGFIDAANDADAFSSHTCSYLLVEDCYSFGNARYHFHYYNTDHSIFRRCVARHDRGSWKYQVGFQVYNSANILVQNCIFIDGDQDIYYNNPDQYFAFKVPQINRDNIYFEGCIALNSSSADFLFVQAGENNFANNCIAWGLKGGDYFRGQTVEVSHCTYGNLFQRGTWGDGSIKKFHDNLLYDIAAYGIYRLGGTIENNYNSLYLVNLEYYDVEPDSHSLCNANSNAIDPIDGSPGNGIPALKYLPRIEDGSDLDGAASDGGDIGATVLYKIGRSGTLWGEEGYNETTDEPLWPFPNEDLIKEKMSAYTYDQDGDGNPEITGKRGFCADGAGLYGGRITLTSYIWEYLGNPCPVDVCNYYDVNRDGHVNVQDIQIVANHILGIATSENADTTGDGSVTIQDVQGVVNVILAGTQG